MLINLYPLEDVAVLYTAASFRNTNLIESSLCLKLFSESSSQFGENLETLVTRPLLSHSYVSLPHVLPRAAVLGYPVHFPVTSLSHSALTRGILPGPVHIPSPIYRSPG